jgi:D-inositol-3-phosphate glycosyltransferase
MHIVLVHRDLHQVTRGGICTLYRSLAAELARLGHCVALLGQETPHPVTAPGVQVVTLPRTEDLDAHRRAVAAAVDRIAPDVVECSSWEAELLGYTALPSSRRVPVLVRGDLPAATMHALGLVEAEREICELADRVIAVSDYAADALSEAYGLSRLLVVPNGVDQTRFHPGEIRAPRSGWRVRLGETGTIRERTPLSQAISTDPQWADFFTPSEGQGPRLVWVGKFTQMKGFDRLERLIARLPGGARLLILLGHGQVHYPVTDLDAFPGVMVCQDLDDADMPYVYRAADYLVSTSRWEGFGLAIAEALACGTPALLPADLDVAPELITSDVTGALWASTGDLIDLLVRRPALRAALPARYSWAANAEVTLALYQGLLQRGGAGT